MSDELLPHYNRELAYIRKLAGEFAEANPKIAGRLRLTGETTEDPHVSRLIEAFAYLNARTRLKIEDDFPEVTEALLGVLYPHYLRPLPSTSIVRFRLDPTQAELASGYAIERGEVVETEAIAGQPCRFRTAYPVHLWPIDVRQAEYRGNPVPAPLLDVSSETQAVLRLRLQKWSDKLPWSDMPLEQLRFYVRGQSQYVYRLYEAIMNQTLRVAAATSPDASATVLDPDSIAAVGFDRNEGLYDYGPQSFLGYRLLSEYFAMPEKFLFFDIRGLQPFVRQLDSSPSFDLFFYLNEYEADLEANVDAESFQLGCTPIVNLFKHRAQPIQVSHTESQYRVVPDSRRPLAYEVYSIDRVVLTNKQRESKEVVPFYSIHHGLAQQERAFWHATRRPSAMAGGQLDRASEVFLSLVDLDFNPAHDSGWTVDVECTCLNRNLPSRLPFGGGQPLLQLARGGPLAKIQCLTAPTATRRPTFREGTLWRLISHLSLGHMSLVDHPEGAAALREILTLYDFTNSPETRAMIEGLLSVSHRRTVRRVGGSVASGFCRGVEVTLHFDEERFSGGSVFLFASVLERFLALYSSINSFTQTVATTNRREHPLRRWQPRAGERSLV